MPVRLWDVTHLELDVTLDPGKRSLAGSTVHHIAPLLDQTVFRLHQGALDIGTVTVDGQTVDVRTQGEWLEVPVAPGRSHEVRVEYAASPEQGMFFRSKRDGYAVTEVWTQGEGEDNRYWFPSWDYPNDLFTVNTTVTAPRGLTVRANGALVDQVRDGPSTTWRFELEQPIVNYLVALVAGEYQVVEGEAGEVPTEILGPRTYPEAWLRNGTAVDGMLPFLEDLLGVSYPYPVYRQVFVQGFLYGGMENATVTTITDERLAAPGSPARISRLEGVVAHELAHHWFGDLLTCYGWRELWLNEGFATFYEQRWREHERGAEYAAAARYHGRDRARKGKHPMAARAHSKLGRDNDRVYVRGSAVLHALRVHFGDEVFDAVIRSWVKDNQHRLVESEDLRRTFEDHTGQHLGWLWDGWVYGGGQPSWKTRWAYGDGKLTVTLDPQGQTAYHTPVQVQIGSDPVRTETIWLDGRSDKLVVELDAAPRWVAVDPRAAVIGTFEQSQPTDAWLAQLNHSPTPMARIDAMVELAEVGEDRVSAALASVAAGEADGYYRYQAVRALTDQGTDTARDALIDLLASDDPYASVREAAAEALASYEGPEVERALQRASTADPDARTRGQALVSYSQVVGPRGRQALRNRLKRADDSFTGVEHGPALTRLAEVGELEDARAALRFFDAAHPRWVRVRAMDMVAKLLRTHEDDDGHAALQRAYIDRTAPLLTHVDVRLRQAAIRSFEVAHREDLDALKRFANTTEVPALRKAARDVLTNHGKPKPDTSDDGLEKRLDALEAGFEAVGERLDALETW